MKILFLCRHNRFRSKVAEAIFNKLNKNKKFRCESAGLMIDVSRMYVAPYVIEAARKKGYIIKGKPRRITSDQINNFNILIIVADNVDKDFFSNFKGKIIQWQVSDCEQEDYDGIVERVGEIERLVKYFLIEIKYRSSSL